MAKLSGRIFCASCGRPCKIGGIGHKKVAITDLCGGCGHRFSIPQCDYEGCDHPFVPVERHHLLMKK